MNKPDEPITSDNQRGISVFELLFAVATIGAAVLFGAIDEPKIPKGLGD